VRELAENEPRRVGPYGLVGWLGAGGMGAVYLGRSPGGRAVAVKVVHAELARDGAFRDRPPGPGAWEVPPSARGRGGPAGVGRLHRPGR
jgi:hypothetical protein